MTQFDEKYNDEVSKHFSKHKKQSRIKKCFCENEDCNKIIDAHSISRSTLKRIKDTTSSGEKVIVLSDVKIDNGNITNAPSLKGWAEEASVFNGFCGFHDNKIFEPIENSIPFNKTEEQCFLHSYRSFAVTYHKRKEQENFLINSLEDTITSVKTPFNELSNAIDGVKERVPGFDALLSEQLKHIDTQGIVTAEELKKDGIGSLLNKVTSLEGKLKQGKESNSTTHALIFEPLKKKLATILSDKEFGKLKYIVRVEPLTFPFATAGCFFAKIIDDSKNSFVFYDHQTQHNLTDPCIILTIVPENEKGTIIILSCFQDDLNACHFLNKLADIKVKEEFQKAISAIVLNACSDNTFVNPKLWEKICFNDEDKIIAKEISKQRPLDTFKQPPYLSSINLFNPKYSIEDLKI